MFVAPEGIFSGPSGAWTPFSSSSVQHSHLPEQDGGAGEWQALGGRGLGSGRWRVGRSG